MLTDTIQSYNDVMLRCWVWFPGKELGGVGPPTNTEHYFCFLPFFFCKSKNRLRISVSKNRYQCKSFVKVKWCKAIFQGYLYEVSMTGCINANLYPIVFDVCQFCSFRLCLLHGFSLLGQDQGSLKWTCPFQVYICLPQEKGPRLQVQPQICHRLASCILLFVHDHHLQGV